MVMVDSSVWIDMFRRRPTRQVELLKEFAVDGEACIADLCLFEVLQGVKPEEAFQRTYEEFGEFRVISVGGEAIAVQAARNAQALRARGIQPMVVDCLLATYCIVNEVRLLTSDLDFEPFAAHLGLILVR